MDKPRVRLHFFVLLLFWVSAAGAQDTFKGIVPFVTTRAEVEKMMLGRPVEHSRYEFEDGRASIFYRESVCEKTNKSCFCLAPLDTVLSVRFQPYTDIKIEDLNLDPKLWIRVPGVGGHVPGLELYVNEKSGVTYELDSRGFVNAIVFRESEETCQVLRNRIDTPANASRDRSICNVSFQDR
jgi:hypothetical protein